MKRAIFAGTFDPVTVGHEEMIEKASALFDELVVALCFNPEKKAMFSREQRLEMLKKTCSPYKNVTVVCHEGLLVDLMRSENINVNVRGIRNSTDLKYENEMSYFNSRLMPDILTVYIPCGLGTSLISSSAIRELILLGQPVDGYVPEGCAELIKKYRKQ